MMWRALAVAVLTLTYASVASSSDYLNKRVSRSLAMGHSAAFMPVSVAGRSAGQVVELFYTREVPGDDHDWNWIAAGNQGRSGLPPGHYRVNFVEFGNQTSYAINEDDTEVGSFDLAPGELVYLGHVTFVPSGLSLQVVVQDRFEEFRARLPEDQRDRVQRRLVQFPQRYDFQDQRTYRVH